MPPGSGHFVSWLGLLARGGAVQIRPMPSQFARFGGFFCPWLCGLFVSEVSLAVSMPLSVSEPWVWIGAWPRKTKQNKTKSHRRKKDCNWLSVLLWGRLITRHFRGDLRGYPLDKKYAMTLVLSACRYTRIQQKYTLNSMLSFFLPLWNSNEVIEGNHLQMIKLHGFSAFFSRWE